MICKLHGEIVSLALNHGTKSQREVVSGWRKILRQSNVGAILETQLEDKRYFLKVIYVQPGRSRSNMAKEVSCHLWTELIH